MLCTDSEVLVFDQWIERTVGQLGLGKCKNDQHLHSDDMEPANPDLMPQRIPAAPQNTSDHLL